MLGKLYTQRNGRHTNDVHERGRLHSQKSFERVVDKSISFATIADVTIHVPWSWPIPSIQTNSDVYRVQPRTHAYAPKYECGWI